MRSPQLPRQSKAQKIARESAKIFEGLLRSDEWLDIRIHQEHDFGLDYRLEAIEAEELLGFEFYVQLKGFEEIADLGKLSLKLKCSTVRYWKSKLLPVLLVVVDCRGCRAYFDWFDKSTRVPRNRQTMTLRLPKAEPLVGRLLWHSIEPYFRRLDHALSDEAARALLVKLSSQTMIMTTVIMRTNEDLRAIGEEDIASRVETLYFYFDCLSTFLKHVELYTRQAPAAWGPVQKELDPLLSALRESHRAMYYKSSRNGSREVFEGRLEDVAHSLPLVTRLAADLSRFLAGRLAVDGRSAP